MKSTPAGQDDISGTTERKWTQSTAALAHEWILICHTGRRIYIQAVLGVTYDLHRLAGLARVM